MVRDGGTVTIDVFDDGKGTVDGRNGRNGNMAGGAKPLGSGQGLAGMRERARIYAGSVEAGRTAERRMAGAGQC